MNKTRRHIPIRLALGIAATALIADFVTLLLRNPLTSTDPGQNLPECAQWTQMAARFLEMVM